MAELCKTPSYKVPAVLHAAEGRLVRLSTLTNKFVAFCCAKGTGITFASHLLKALVRSDP